MRARCLPGSDASDSDCAIVNRLVERRHKLTRGAVLFQSNDPVRERLYAIRGGAVKTTQLAPDGALRVSAFYTEGELLGLDTLDTALHGATASALSDCIVCEISYSALIMAARQSATLARQVEALLGRELARQQDSTRIRSYVHADQKLASFLLASAPGGTRPHLPMSRQDIGDYLGLTDATVSRLLRQLHRRGCITAPQRALDILDPKLLGAIASGETAAA
jgi:CRP/FNR family transcriptional regulator